MAGVEARDFDSPDEIRSPDKTTLANVRVGTALVARATMQPGWRWSECIKPIAGTDDCQVHHLGLVLSGSMHVVHRDGTKADLVAGKVYEVQPGHDAWVVGDEPFVGVEFDAKTVADFANG